MAYDPNQAHPKIPFLGKYPNLRVTQHPDGTQKLHSVEPGKESLFHIHGTGSYSGFGPLGQMVSVVVDKAHQYMADGHSHTVDGHHDHKVSGSSRKSTSGGEHKETAGNKYEGGGGVHIAGSNDSHINTQANGDKFHTTEGHETTDHTGDISKTITGDVITNIKGTSGTMVSGECFVNVQNGSYDVKVAKKIKLEATEGIELRVGKNTINLYPGGIAIQSDGGFMNIFVINSSQNLVIENTDGGKAGLIAYKNDVVVASDQNNTIISAGVNNIIKSSGGTKVEAGTSPPIGKYPLPPVKKTS